MQLHDKEYNACAAATCSMQRVPCGVISGKANVDKIDKFFDSLKFSIPNMVIANVMQTTVMSIFSVVLPCSNMLKVW